MNVRSDEEEEQIDRKIEANYKAWHLRAIGDDEVWITPSSEPHPDLVAWCGRWQFTIKEYGVPETGEGPDVEMP